MEYIVSSRGRPIGVTDLGFIRYDRRHRAGWFYPNEAGERVMPVVGEVLPALWAYAKCDRVAEDGTPIPRDELLRSSLYADLAEALHHAEALDLTLHYPDGSLVPTESVGIRDIEVLLSMPDDDDDEEFHDRPWQLNDPIEEAIEHDMAILTNNFTDMHLFEDPNEDKPWLPAEEEPEFPRYQIMVLLAEDDAIP